MTSHEQAVQNMIDDAHTWVINRAKVAQENMGEGTPFPMYRYVLIHCLSEGLEEIDSWEEIRRVREARFKACKTIRMLVGENVWETSGYLHGKSETSP